MAISFGAMPLSIHTAQRYGVADLAEYPSAAHVVSGSAWHGVVDYHADGVAAEPRPLVTDAGGLCRQNGCGIADLQLQPPGTGQSVAFAVGGHPHQCVVRSGGRGA